MAETIYLATTGNDSTAVHNNPSFPYATLTTALTSISSHDTTLLIKDGTYTLTSSDGVKDSSNPTNEPGDDPFPNLVHVVKSNITLSAENVHKAIIDCQNTQGAIWFMTTWADGINSSNRTGDADNSGVGDTRSNTILVDGLIIKNFKKISSASNNAGAAVKNGSGAGFINVSQGYVPAVGTAGSDVTLNRCVLSGCVVQNGALVQGTAAGIVCGRRQDFESAKNTPLSAELHLPGQDINVNYIPPPNETAQGGIRVTYKQCLFNDIKTDETSENAGTYGLFGFRNVGQYEDPPSTGDFITRPVSANLINNIFYFTGTGGNQYQWLFSQDANDAGSLRSYNNTFNIVNNIFYNTGDPILINRESSLSELNYSYGQGSTTTNTVTSSNVYKNNCFLGFTSAGGFPFNMEYNSSDGNLFDTDPQLLGPTQNRFGLRQNSPCKGTGVVDPNIL